MTFASMLAITWNPELRGIVAVLVGFVVLCGSAVLRSLDVTAALLDAHPRARLVVTGGRGHSTPHLFAAVRPWVATDDGASEAAVLASLLVSRHAVDPGRITLEEAATKEMVARHARRTVVLAHAAKLAESEVPAWGRLPDGWTLVTDESDEQSLAPFRGVGVEVVTAGAP